jgi:hypothetical protein
MPSEVSFFVALERRVWQALADGDAAADMRLLDPRFLGVYASGFASRQDHAAQLETGPSVRSFSIDEPRLLRLAPDAVLLSYRASFMRPDADAPPVSRTMYISSVWKKRGERWVNLFSQDTAAEDPTQ